MGDPVLHIELRKWADVMLVAPLSANTLAKLANGVSDNLLTCVARAWDLSLKPFVVCPAMNTMMWDHPLTGRHIRAVTGSPPDGLGFRIIAPVEKLLACGDLGMGAMAEVATILDFVRGLTVGHVVGARDDAPGRAKL